MKPQIKPQLNTKQCDICWRVLTPTAPNPTQQNTHAKSLNGRTCTACRKSQELILIMARRERLIHWTQKTPKQPGPKPPNNNWQHKALCIQRPEVAADFYAQDKTDDETTEFEANTRTPLHVWCFQCPAIKQCLAQKLAHQDTSSTYAAVSGGKQHHDINTLFRYGWTLNQILNLITHPERRNQAAQKWLNQTAPNAPTLATKTLAPIGATVKVVPRSRNELFKWLEVAPTGTFVRYSSQNDKTYRLSMKIKADCWRVCSDSEKEETDLSDLDLADVIRVPSKITINYPAYEPFWEENEQ